MNNKGEKGNTWIIIALIAVGIYLLVPSVQTSVNNIFGGIFGGTTVPTDSNLPTDTNLAKCPTTGKTSYTLSVQDANAATATNFEAQYYVFNGDGMVKDGNAGTGSDGTVDFDVTCGKDYELIVLNQSVVTGAYSVRIPLKARTAEQTVGAAVTRFGTPHIVGIENPDDPAGGANVSLAAGQTKGFLIKFNSNVTNRGTNKPIIMCQVNTTSIQTVTYNSFSDGKAITTPASTPTRITASAGYKYYSVEYPGMLLSEQGTVGLSGTITAVAAVTPATVDYMECIIVDQATTPTSQYKTAKTIDTAFVFGPEDPDSPSTNVGAVDSSKVQYEYAGSY